MRLTTVTSVVTIITGTQCFQQRTGRTEKAFKETIKNEREHGKETCKGKLCKERAAPSAFTSARGAASVHA
jgi:hypothetical protein